MLRTWSAVDGASSVFVLVTWGDVEVETEFVNSLVWTETPLECEPLGSQAPASARPLVKTLSRSSSHAFTVSSSSCASLLSDDDNDTNNNTMDNNYDHHHNNSSNDSHEPAPLDSNDDNQRALSFQDENERLRRQVADLESALVVRDMELATLQERCHFLLTSVETQDEVIAKIYAATAATEALPGGPRSRRSSSAPVSTPTSLSASVDAQRQRRVHSAAGVRALFSSSSQERRPRGAVPTLAPPTKPTKPNKKNLKSVTAEPAHELLEAQLDSIGYEPQRATDALESLVDGPPLLTRTNSVASVGERTRVGQLDELLFPPPPTSASLFGSTDASPSSGAVTSPSPSLDVRVAKSGDFRQSPFVERQSSLPRDEDFAQSAGFLRKANRKLSGRLSVSDFGLLSDDTALFARSSSSEQSELAGSGEPENDNDDDNNDDGASDISDAAGKRRQRRTASQRNLFAEIDVAASEAAKRKKNQHQQQTSSGAPTREHEPSELTYAEFLERISLPASRDILHRIRLFVGSVLGPRGDGKPPRSTDYVDYDFYGPHEFQRRYEQFFRKIDATLAAHPAWRHATETTLVKARDGVEKYVMDKLSDLAFTQLPVCAQWKADDDRLFRRMKLLSVRTCRCRRCCLGR